MADPAVQAALEVLAATRHLSMKMKVAELIVAAVTPLIRRQAFTEAADALLEVPSVRDQPRQTIQQRLIRLDLALAAIRGLAEGTDHQWQSGEKRPDGLRTWTCQTCGGQATIDFPPPKGPCPRRLGAATIDQ